VEAFMSNPVNVPPVLHVREHGSLLAPAEKLALIWIARRLPAFINSDHLSALALASMATAGLSFAAFHLGHWAAVGVIVSLVLNWFGDSLDGTVARVRGVQRPRYGFYVDHVLDLAGATFLFAGLAASGLMNPLLGVAVLAGYVIVAAESYLATHSAGVFRMSFLRFGPTELRIVLAMGVWKAAQSPRVSIGPLDSVQLFDLGGVVALAGFVIAFTVSAVRNTRALYAAEPLPHASRGSRVAA
jgi:archaetidylinositol phosphate synthase